MVVLDKFLIFWFFFPVGVVASFKKLVKYTFSRTIVLARSCSYLESRPKQNFNFSYISSSRGCCQTLLMYVVGYIAISHTSLHKWEKFFCLQCVIRRSF